jgi:hypothetical protein
MADRDQSRFEDIALGETLTFTIERGEVERDQTFSPEAMRAVSAAMIEFMLTQIAKRWEQTNEPPTYLTVKIQCDVG